MIEAGTKVKVYVEQGDGTAALFGKLVNAYGGTNRVVVLDRYGSETIIPGHRIIYVEVERERIDF